MRTLDKVDGERGSRGRAVGKDLACTFCGRSQFEVRKLIAGSSAYVCDACVALADGVIGSGSAAGTPLGQVRAVPVQDGQACGFCGKPRYRVAGLAAMTAETGGRSSGTASICSECVELCTEIISE